VSERLWRCAECGKWSHAKRRPPWHTKFAGDEPPEGAVIAESNEVMEYDTGAKYDVFWIRCGPFEPWTADREQAAA
jgi:hypothetical protein